MVPFSQHIGELRVRYAGFFDSGFGLDDTNKGTVGVLEVRANEHVTVYDGQPIAMFRFFENDRVPEKPYGTNGSNYAKQKGPTLAKYFTQED